MVFELFLGFISTFNIDNFNIYYLVDKVLKNN